MKIFLTALIFYFLIAISASILSGLTIKHFHKIFYKENQSEI